MSNTQRPTLQRKQTRASEKARQDALDETFGVRINGEDWVLCPADVTGLQEMRIRRESGYSVAELIDKMQTAPGVDLIGVFMWVCRLVGGQPADLEEILGSVSYASEVDILEAPEPTPPEA